MGKFKFGVYLPFYIFQAEEPKNRFTLLRDIVLECERLGYHSAWLDDHLMYNGWPILESWITLSALSSLTSRIHLGTMVSCNAHRNPALLAKMAATFDVLSNGRLEFGIGAGAQMNEHIAYGFGFPTSSVRIGHLSEALQVITQLWTKDKANYHGKYYTLKDAICEPKPLQKPYPTITIGGSGELLMRKVTAPFADRFDWGYLPSIELYEHKLEILETHCKSVGRNFEEIEKSCWPGGQVVIAKNQNELQEKILKRKPSNVSSEDFKKTVLYGTLDESIDQLQVYVDLGVTYFMLFFSDLPNLDDLRQFARKVMNRVN